MNETQYCSPGWAEFWSNYYAPIDGYAKFVICVVGCLTNGVNLWIFGQKNMQMQPINKLLSALALSDFFFVFSQLFLLSLGVYKDQFGEGWATESSRVLVEMLIDIICYDLFHTCSIFLTLTVAIWRLIAVKDPLKSRNWLGISNAKWAILVAVISAIGLLPLQYIGVSIETVAENGGAAGGSENADWTRLANLTEYKWHQSPLGQHFHFWIHALLVKLIPCVVMTGVSITLITLVMKARQIQRSTPEAISLNDQRERTTEEADKEQAKEFDRVTKMVLAILILFLLTEFPVGILDLLTRLVESPDQFSLNCFHPIKSFLELDELLSSTTNFFIYLALGRTFRSNFYQFFSKSSVSRSVNGHNFTAVSTSNHTRESEDRV